MKNTVAITCREQVFVSQHIGDLETVAAVTSFEKTITSLKQLYEFEPSAVACDAHPHYLSTQFALTSTLSVVPVQHHYAHVLACMAENGLVEAHNSTPPVLGIAWDGTGYGLDGTLWGGEFLQVTERGFQRVAHLRQFRLPGGEKAIAEPRRVAIGLLYEILGDALFEMKELAPLQAFTTQELSILKTMLKSNINAPLTSGMGRLFDAIASITGLRQKTEFEGQAAMELEFALLSFDTDEKYRFEIIKPSKASTLAPAVVDWAIVVQEILKDMHYGIPTGYISAKFHNTLVEIIVTLAKQMREKRVVLTGGCFQNRYLTERAIQRLRDENFCPYWHSSIPQSDGSIALGQVVAAARSIVTNSSRSETVLHMS